MYTKDLLTIYIDSQGNISDTLIFFSQNIDYIFGCVYRDHFGTGTIEDGVSQNLSILASLSSFTSNFDLRFVVVGLHVY